ncbi:class I SAM-dependent methyltransferase [Buchnera aphidicola]|uniref:class I SAM-dependent methyltransferase n=1 Tax=Buchnera aphidicola TaxID=9 RepID=UPI00346405DD
MKYKINIIDYTNGKYKEFLLKNWNIQQNYHTEFSLIIHEHRIELKNNANKNIKNIWIDFNHKKMKSYQDDSKIKIIKAIGIKKKPFLNVIDATAGLGKDSFMMFSYGCTITMIENNPILSILIYDGLKRSYNDPIIGNIIKKKMKHINHSSINIQSLNLQKPDVIYLDPMFPRKKKKSLPKKHMNTIQNLVKKDSDTQLLFNACKNFAKNRIVVKRKKNFKIISKNKPNYMIYSKKYRFDVYLIHKNLKS